MTSWNDESVLAGPTVSGLAVPGTGVQVYQLATGVALAETCFPVLDKAANPTNSTPLCWLSMMCDDGAGNSVGFYIITGQPGHFVPVPAPDPLANITAPLNANQQCLFVPAGIEYHRKFYANQFFRAIQYSGANAYLRVEATSSQSV